MSGTIFDEPGRDLGVNYQRRLGFWYAHGINPGAISRGVDIVMLTETHARIFYKAVVLAEGETQWGNGSSIIPTGVPCDHGDSPHRVVEKRHIDVPLSEISAEGEQGIATMQELAKAGILGAGATTAVDTLLARLGAELKRDTAGMSTPERETHLMDRFGPDASRVAAVIMWGGQA